MSSSDEAQARPIRLAVGIATVGRPQILIETIRDLMAQSRPAERIIVCPGSGKDAEGLAETFPEVEIVEGGRGLTRQRNAILAAAKDADVIVFFDDDFIAARDYLAGVETLMVSHPDVVVGTGEVIADGILGPGYTVAQARELVARDAQSTAAGAPRVEDTHGGYGCNFAIRMAALRHSGVRFDEKLPSYGWLEDLDFSANLQAANPGSRIVRDRALRGVHMGAKVGRQSGVRLGYSQVVNPVYIARKGVLPRAHLYRLVLRNTLANLAKSLRAEPYIDRRGRLWGNLRGYFDVLRGRDDPQKIDSF